MGGRDEYNPRSSEGPARSSEGPARIIPDPARLLYCPRGCSALKQFSGSGAPPSEDEISAYRTIQMETPGVFESPRCVPEPQSLCFAAFELISRKTWNPPRIRFVTLSQDFWDRW